VLIHASFPVTFKKEKHGQVKEKNREYEWEEGQIEGNKTEMKEGMKESRRNRSKRYQG
jgi:hypothetical protein